jgi:hypothetical protein
MAVAQQQIIIQKGGDFRPLHSNNANYYIRILENVINSCPTNLIVNLNGTRYVVNKNENFLFQDPNMAGPGVIMNNQFNNNVIFNLPAATKYCITDIIIDPSCMAKTTSIEDEYYCNIVNTQVILSQGTVLYDMYGNKFIVDKEIKNAKLQ